MLWTRQPLPFWLDRIFTKFAGNQDRHKILGLVRILVTSDHWLQSYLPLRACKNVVDTTCLYFFIWSFFILLRMRTDIKSRMSSIFLFLIGSLWNLQINRTIIKSWTSLKFGKIQLSRVTCPRVLKKPKFELVNAIAHLVLIRYLWNLQITRTHEIWDEFETGPHCTVYFALDCWKGLAHILPSGHAGS